MRWILTAVLSLTVVLAACGGSGDDDDENDADATPASTATLALAATATQRTVTTPTLPLASPSAIPTGLPGGGGGIGDPSGTATQTTAEPTPTRRPATVVSTPRLIARTPTPAGGVPTETVTDGSDITVVVNETFDDPAASLFYQGETDFGVVAAIVDGRYSLTVPDGAWQNIVITEYPELGNGLMLVDATIEGNGTVGLVGRSITEDDGSWTFYVCWLSSDGSAGCHASVRSEWVELFVVPAGSIQLLDVNQLFLSIDGDEIYFDINDIVVGVISDASSTAGTWGVYAESLSGTITAWYDNVVIAEYPPQ